MRRTLVNIIRISVLLSSILLVSGCGGHGGGGHRHPAPSVHVTLSSPGVSEELAAGDEIPSMWMAPGQERTFSRGRSSWTSVIPPHDS